MSRSEHPPAGQRERTGIQPTCPSAGGTASFPFRGGRAQWPCVQGERVWSPARRRISALWSRLWHSITPGQPQRYFTSFTTRCAGGVVDVDKCLAGNWTKAIHFFPEPSKAKVKRGEQKVRARKMGGTLRSWRMMADEYRKPSGGRSPSPTCPQCLVCAGDRHAVRCWGDGRFGKRMAAQNGPRMLWS